MTFIITKDFRFEASHHLPQLRDGHKCQRNHGHSYLVRVEIHAEALDPVGFVEDYGELNDIRAFIDNVLDHQNLSQLYGGENTTAERLCLRFFTEWKRSHPGLKAVTICETPSVSATYREP